MKIKTLILTMLFAVSMWAQTAAPVPADKSADAKATASCCKDGAACCKDGAGCCGKDKMAKADGKDCCGGNMCKRHKAEKS
jgi:hypothetical protein